MRKIRKAFKPLNRSPLEIMHPTEGYVKALFGVNLNG
jgi:hypothetical protein